MRRGCVFHFKGCVEGDESVLECPVIDSLYFEVREKRINYIILFEIFFCACVYIIINAVFLRCRTKQTTARAHVPAIQK